MKNACSRTYIITGCTVAREVKVLQCKETETVTEEIQQKVKMVIKTLLHRIINKIHNSSVMETQNNSLSKRTSHNSL